MPVATEAPTAERDMQSECWTCQHRREVPGESHIRCAKPDPDMTGHEHGIRRGWFIYPLLFDPTWKTRLCANYEQQEPRS